MVAQAEKKVTPGLTLFLEETAEAAAERLKYLERDRWPEFERELKARKPRRTRFDVHHYGAERQAWEGLVWRCRTWSEVERVLNRFGADWEKKGGRVEMDGLQIYRCA